MAYCDYCNEDKPKVYTLSNHHDCCSECLEDVDDDTLRIVDPDDAYDRYRERQDYESSN